MTADGLRNWLLRVCLITFPFWEVGTAQLRYFAGVPESALGAAKYGILLFSLLLAFSSASINRFFAIRSYIYFAAIYVLYTTLHFVSSTQAPLMLEGFRLELLLPLIAVFIAASNDDSAVTPEQFTAIVKFQGYVVATFALWQLFDIRILEILYRKPTDQIPHLSWFSLPRLISLIGNPISLGAFMSIWLVAVWHSTELAHVGKPRSGGRRGHAVLVASAIGALVTVMTLSRTSLIAYLAVALSVLSHGSSKRKLLAVILPTTAIFGITLLMTSDIDTDVVFKRFGNLGNIEEYSGNLRVSNWGAALKDLEGVNFFWGLGIGHSTPSEELAEKYNGAIVESAFVSQLVNYGIVGLALYTTIIIRFARCALIIFRENAGNGKMLMLMVFIHCFFGMANDFHRNQPFSLYFWLLYLYAERAAQKLRVQS